MAVPGAASAGDPRNPVTPRGQQTRLLIATILSADDERLIRWSLVERPSDEGYGTVDYLGHYPIRRARRPGAHP